MSRPHVNPLAIWIGILVLWVVWGSTYLGMKLAMDSLPPFIMGAARFVPAGVLLSVLVIAWNRGGVPMPTGRQLLDATIVGTLLLVGGTGLVAWGEQTIATGIAALLIALVPMWLAIFGRVLFREAVPGIVAAGIVVGLVGVAILAWPAGGVGDLDPAGLAALLVSPILWSLGTLYAARRAVLPAPALLASGFEMVAAGLAFVVLASISGEWSGFDVAAVTATSWLGIGYLVVIGSLVGYTTFAWLIQVAPLSRVSTYAYVNPVVAVVLGSLFLAEPFTARTIVASIVIVAAVVLIVTGRGRAAGSAAGDREPVAVPSPAAAPSR
jgi:drug/metabolite transporter (DMT)-like permease